MTVGGAPRQDATIPSRSGDVLLRWAVSAVCCCAAEFVTFPLDITKTRLQLQRNQAGAQSVVAGAPPGQQLRMWQMTAAIARAEGFGALYSGVGAALLRQAVYGGIGIGLYPHLRGLLLRGGDPSTAPLWKRALAGMVTGGVGQAIASPTDVVKVRLQADGRMRLQGQAPRYSGTLDAFVKIAREEGLQGFFRGLGPNVQRAAVINGAGIAAYDHTKQVVLRLTGHSEGLQAQVVGALTSGLVSAVVANPLDVVKTRMMNLHSSSKQYRGSLDCMVQTVRGEGVMALYKGFAPSYVRLAPWQIVFFLAFEAASKVLHLGQL